MSIFHKVDQLLVTSDMSLKESFFAMNEGREGILLLVDDDGCFIRTITDGDLRRVWIRKEDMSATLALLPTVESATLPRASYSPANALARMDEKQVDKLPLLDETGHPVALVHRREIPATLYLSAPHLGEQEMEFVNEAFRSNWIAPLGPNVDGFEREMSEYTGCAHAAALSSGTAALHLALLMLGVGSGDRVFCSDLTFVASTNPILYLGAVPVLIDAEPRSWNLCPDALERALEDAARTGQPPKAVIAVHLYGQSVDLDRILALCDHYKVPLIEDAAESLGATYRGKQTGTFGRMGVYSFNGNKIITTSGGGMLVSDDGSLIEKARFLSTQARDPAAWYQHSELGYNYRMSNILAGVGRGQLRVLDERVQIRRRIFQRYQEGLQEISAIRFMPELEGGAGTRWLSALSLDPECGVRPADIIAKLAEQNIEARHVWKPMHLQPLYAGVEFHPHSSDESVSAAIFENGLCLPSGSSMSDADQDRVIEVIRGMFANGS